MAKTNEEKNAEKLAKKQAQKAKKNAKRAKLLEKRRAIAAAKKEKRAAKKARLLVRREKAKARKLAIREKKRLRLLKKREQEKAKKLKLKEKAKVQKTIKQVDAKLTVKNTTNIEQNEQKTLSAVRQCVKNAAKALSTLDGNKLEKKLKKLDKLGYQVLRGPDGILLSVSYSFAVDIKPINKIKENVEKPKRGRKTKIDKTKADVISEILADDVKKAVAVPELDDEPKVDVIPAGDLFGTDGQVNDAEVANLESDDTPNDIDDVIDSDDDDTIIDSRDETDKDLIDARREFFGNAAEYGDDFEN